jgi:amidohydrolase
MTGGEDFACYAEKVPGLFFFLGVKASPEPAGLHSPHFLLNEAALPVGVRTMALLAVEYLVRQAK